MYQEPKDVRGVRVGAAIIDLIIYSILTGIVLIIRLSGVFKFQYGGFNRSLILITFVVQVLIAFSYFTLIPYFTKGRTLGKLITGIRVISSNYDDASFLKLTFRNVNLFYSLFIQGFFLLISFEITAILGLFSNNIMNLVNFINLMFVLISKDARGFHDYIAGTIVVSKHFSPEAIGEVNAIERSKMEWAVFEDDVKSPDLKEEKIQILNTDDDEIEILKDKSAK